MTRGGYNGKSYNTFQSMEELRQYVNEMWSISYDMIAELGKRHGYKFKPVPRDHAPELMYRGSSLPAKDRKDPYHFIRSDEFAEKPWGTTCNCPTDGECKCACHSS